VATNKNVKVGVDRRTNKTRKYSSSFFEGEGGERHTEGADIWGKLLSRKKKVLIS